MSGSIFSSGDPWENGWASNDNANIRSSTIPGFESGSTYLTSSQLLKHDDTRDANDLGEIPVSYKKVYSALSEDISTVTDLERSVFNKLVDAGYLTSYQSSKILDTLYDHAILPPSEIANFGRILGLIALELDAAGTGEYVTLQMRLNNLPDLSDKVVHLLINNDDKSETKDIVDPLSAQLANSGLPENDRNEWHADASEHKRGGQASILSDPILTDHTSVQQSHLDGGGEQQPADHSHIAKYINNIRDTFTPLLEYLLKKYPFRVIPGLPPKKFSVGSSPDSQFLQRRRRGLFRFLNQIVKHPVLRQDALVVTFLSVPTDLTTWKKQAKIDYSLEFKGRKISTEFINSIWPTIGEEFLNNWKNAENNITKLIELWTKIVMLVERYEKRQQQVAYDNGKFVEMIKGFSLLNGSLYPHSEEHGTIIGNNNKDDMNSINDSLDRVSGFFNKSSQVLIDESYAINTSVLEKFKNYLDYLYSLQELFERSRKLSANNIAQLQIRIHDNEQKYNKLSSDNADIKGSDLAKLRQVIINDKQEIFQQLNKDWLIKDCVLDEFLMFQETQYLISEMWVEWCKGRYKFQDKIFELHDNLNNEVVNDMPLSR
ncbi:DEHA2F15950p [Debaryomyces hansenii CBS767]|uniref:Sorting nexin MVP1 n=1 Tax=Debaryomyces hansenii (strain ATCC 36239 / CBS 767 / BCRC 21394 / JCM 1990 / NBRC 0083 / IGC 2968) TaxID=284592 RepID=W0TYU0_DEBHA|nr:DEHA2F15950p [Debaryomyces hansenii CBS767]CAG89428.4 DEHA2F15950p [Debaryomyces hansenii CBS767]|eukprot:XP_002770832.1 DEHA2F15950p [Debaryomyces hansenii CBS767]